MTNFKLIKTSMKKFFLIAAVAVTLGLSSCTTISNTAYTEVVDTEMYNRSSADLSVSDNVITYTYICDASHSRAGVKSVKAKAVQEALKANGGGDVIVNPQYEVAVRRNLFCKKILSVTVTGHPATYKKVHPMTQPEADVVVTLKRKK